MTDAKKTIRNAFLKQDVKHAARATGRVLQKVCIAATVCVMLLTSAFALSEDFRIDVLNTIINVYDDGTQIIFPGNQPSSDDSGSQGEFAVLKNNIGLEWVPDGFEISEENCSSTSSSDMLYLIHPTNGYVCIYFRQIKPGLNYNFDTEDCIKKEIVINRHAADLYIKQERGLRERFKDMPQIWSDMTVFWIDEERGVIININATNLTEKEMVRLSEGVHWLR